MNYPLLSRVIAELSRLLAGAHVDRVFPGDANDIIVCLRQRRENMVLLLSPDRSLPRIHLLSAKPASGGTSHPFFLFLKSRMTGSRIAGIRLKNEDRIVDIHFVRQAAEHHLFFEVMGRAANLILAEGPENILSVYYPVPLSDRITRPLLPGLRYELPEKKELQFGGHRSGDKEASSSQDDESAIAAANREAEVLYDRLTSTKRIEFGRSSLRATVNKSYAKTERRLQALSNDFENIENADGFRQAGDLILANLKNLVPGCREAELCGYDGAKRLVALDPRFSPARNAELYFKKYKKARSGRDIIARRLAEALEESTFLRGLLAEIEKCVDESGFEMIKSHLAERGMALRSQNKSVKQQSTVSPPPSFRSVRCGGWEILVGKSAAGNDYLTTKLAAPDDVWLHAEGLPGSHVVIRNPERKPIPAEVLEKAASLAAFHSKGRGASKVSVTYTLARNVRKPKGAKPGLVTLSERKSIMVAPGEQ